MSNSKARGFLEDILANPDDDAPRLIYADWLDENGDAARAEFIRVQIERTTLPEWDPRQVRLRLREEALLKLHGRKWKAELPRLQDVTWKEFRRGFVATARFTRFSVINANASACWAATPVEAISVRWPRKGEPCERLAPLAGLRELSFLETPVEVAPLADSPLLSTLRVLSISGLWATGFRRLAGSPHLGNLATLRVPFNSIGNEGIDALLGAKSLNALTELDLSDHGRTGRHRGDPVIEAETVATLVAWPGMNRLCSLKMSCTGVGQSGLRTLLRSPGAKGLKVLALQYNELDSAAMQEFDAALPELQLDVLDLGGNLLGNRGAKYLANAFCLRELKTLVLDSCGITIAGARSLAKALFIGSLRKLHINNNNFGSKGLRELLDSNPRNLHTLEMALACLTNEGVVYLAEAPASDSLLDANLCLNDVDDRSLKALASSNYLRNLLVLCLMSSTFSFSAAAKRTLRKSPLGKRLAVLEL
jgi:uncharacterized protein (TIGR02996 family)